MQGYCVKCRSKKEIKGAKAIKMQNGKPATQGTCPTCGTKMYRIGAGKQQLFAAYDNCWLKSWVNLLIFNVITQNIAHSLKITPYQRQKREAQKKLE